MLECNKNLGCAASPKEQFLIFQERVPSPEGVIGAANETADNTQDRLAQLCDEIKPKVCFIKYLKDKKKNKERLNDGDFELFGSIYGEFYKSEMKDILSLLDKEDQPKMAAFMIDCEVAQEQRRKDFDLYLAVKPYLDPTKMDELWEKHDMGKWEYWPDKISMGEVYIYPAEDIMSTIDTDDRERILWRNRGDSDFLKKYNRFLFIPIAKLSNMTVAQESIKEWLQYPYARFYRSVKLSDGTYDEELEPPSEEVNPNRPKVVDVLLDHRLAEVPQDPVITVRTLLSFCVSAEHFLDAQELDYTTENISAAFDIIFDKFEEMKNLPILDKDTKVILVNYNGKGSPETPFKKENAQAMCKRFGAKIVKDLQPKVGASLESALQIKKKFLQAVSSSKGKTTIMFNGHGEADKLVIWIRYEEGQPREENGMRVIPLVPKEDVSVTPQELAQALIRSKNVGNITLLVNACYFYDFQVVLNNELLAGGVAQTPLILGPANKGKTSLRNFYHGDNHFFSALNRASATAPHLNVGHFYAAENNYSVDSQDSFVISPSKDGQSPVEIGLNETEPADNMPV